VTRKVRFCTCVKNENLSSETHFKTAAREGKIDDLDAFRKLVFVWKSFLKKCGTVRKVCRKPLVFSYFPVPMGSGTSLGQTWDKPGTTWDKRVGRVGAPSDTDIDSFVIGLAFGAISCRESRNISLVRERDLTRVFSGVGVCDSNQMSRICDLV